jgi:hypothetical protein
MILISEISIGPLVIDFLLHDRLGNELCLELKSNQHTSHIPVILYSASNNLTEIAGKFVRMPVFRNCSIVMIELTW